MWIFLLCCTIPTGASETLLVTESAENMKFLSIKYCKVGEVHAVPACLNVAPSLLLLTTIMHGTSVKAGTVYR